MFCCCCGKMISDNAKFCQFCGAKVQLFSTLNSVPQANHSKFVCVSEESDRNALLIYLQNLLNMEVSLEELAAKKASIIKHREQLSVSAGYRFFKIYDDRNYYLHFLYEDGIIYILTYNPGLDLGDAIFVEPIDWESLFNDEVIIGSMFDRRNGCIPRLYWLEVEPYYKNLSKIPLIGKNRWKRLYTQGEIVGTANEYMGLNEPYNCEDAVEAFKKYYSLMKTEGARFYNNDCKEFHFLLDDIQYLNQKLETGKALLEDLYSLNVIPRVYRNIYSIYFINDYMQTSGENLQATLIHLDLDTIKKQLADVIEAQRKIIFNQAIIQAQNNELLKANTEMINGLSELNTNMNLMNQNIISVNQNLQQTNRYARIATDNLNTCRWLSELSTYKRLF